MRRHFEARLGHSSFVALLVLQALASACGDDKEELSRDIKIAWIPKGVNNVVFAAGRQGAFASARSLSMQGPDKVSIIYHPSLPDQPTPRDQLPVLQQAIDTHVDGIGISATDATALNGLIDQAVDSGIKVMTWDSDAPASKRFTYLGVDNQEGGRLAARVLARSLKAAGVTSGKLAIIGGNAAAANLTDRIVGFQEGVAAINSEIQTTFTADLVYYCNEDGPLQASIIEAAMGGPAPVQDDDGMGHHQEVTEVPDLRGWFLAGAWALFQEHPVIDRWKQGPSRNVLTVAFDTVPQMLGYLQDGYIVGLIGQKYWGWGYDTVQMIYNVVKGTQSYDQEWTDSGIDVICTAEGAAAMSTMWTTYGFTSSLPPCDLAQ